jgi:hypothetical protein
MTFERKIVVGLEDIASISLECVKCNQRITFSPDTKARQVSPTCSSCGHTWIPQDVSESPLGVFLQMIERIRTINRSNPYGVRILLEYAEPRDKN